MAGKLNFIFLLIPILFSNCKKDYDWEVVYKLMLTPAPSQTNYETKITYRIKDNGSETKIINSTSWEYTFHGKDDDSAAIEAINTSNASVMEITMIVNGTTYKKECRTNGCDIALVKVFDN